MNYQCFNTLLKIKMTILMFKKDIYQEASTKMQTNTNNLIIGDLLTSGR